MKIFLILLLFLPIKVLAEDNQAIGVAYERYSVISGAWFLNQKCNFLANDLSGEFTSNVDLLRQSLLLVLKNPTMNNIIDNGARQAAESDKYKDCGKDAKEIVMFAILASRDWSNVIRVATVVTASKLGVSSDETK